jgi:hypothetical protein
VKVRYGRARRRQRPGRSQPEGSPWAGGWRRVSAGSRRPHARRTGAPRSGPPTRWGWHPRRIRPSATVTTAAGPAAGSSGCWWRRQVRRSSHHRPGARAVRPRSSTGCPALDRRTTALDRAADRERQPVEPRRRTVSVSRWRRVRRRCGQPAGDPAHPAFAGVRPGPSPGVGVRGPGSRIRRCRRRRGRGSGRTTPRLPAYRC